MSTAAGAAKGAIAILVGGDADAFAAARPVLDRLGQLVVHLGPAGSGTAAKLARNLIHLATELGDRLAVDTPLADLALTRLASGLGIAS